jgi:flagellar FliJ protein
MRRFRFRLEKLLELRRHTERQWEIKLAEITGICFLIENRIGEIKVEIDSKRGERFRETARMDYNSLLVSELYVRRLGIELAEKTEELVKKKAEREEIKNVYLEHSKKRKVLDKLKERRESEYYKDQKREEFKVMDDLNSSSYIRHAKEKE